MKMVKELITGVISDSACRLAEPWCFLQTQHVSVRKARKSRADFDYLLPRLGVRPLLGLHHLKQNLPGSGKKTTPPLMTVGLIQLSFVICYAPGGLENVAKAERANSTGETTLHHSSFQREVHLTKDRYCPTCHLALKISVEKPVLLEGSSSR